MKDLNLLTLVLVLQLATVFLVGCADKENDDQLSDLLLNKNHDDGAAWGLASCSSCHAIAGLHSDVDWVRTVVLKKGYGSCTGCHGSNGTPQERQCDICHNEIDLPESLDRSGTHRHNFRVQGQNISTEQSCVVCHKASDMNGVFDPKIDLSAIPNASGVVTSSASNTEFCLSCHNRHQQQGDFQFVDKAFDDPLIAMRDNYRFIDVHGEKSGDGEGIFRGLRGLYEYASMVECVDCHVMHGTDNSSLIIDRVSKGAKLLVSDMSDIHVSTENGNLAQLCVVCHLMDQPQDSADHDTGNGLAGVHQSDGECLSCHSHGEAIQVGL